MTISLPKSVRRILDVLENAGFEAYVVGGCVRDLLSGKAPGDFDVCTSATPADITKLFEETFLTGVKHGTVTVISDGLQVQVTTFRTDGGYGDFRHPDSVRFVSDLETDLSRRDFTVNAMCYSDRTGVIDRFGGLEDLKSKLLRAVGDAQKRFGEDALRILRLFRFASTLNFRIEDKTGLAAIENAHLLKNVSAERIREELYKLSCGICPSAVLPLFAANAFEFLKADERISRITLLAEDCRLKFFAFLRLSGTDLCSALDYLKCDNAFKAYAKRMTEAEKMPCESRTDVKRLLALLETDIFGLLDYRSAILGEDIEKARLTAKEIIKAKEPYRTDQLAVSGDDIVAKGYKGEEVGKKLDALLELVTENPELNRKDKLLRLI